MTSKQLKALRIPDPLLKQLDARTDTVRGGLSDAVRESLERYFYLLDISRQEIQDKFTGLELCLIADLSNGTIWHPMTIINGITTNVQDAEDFYFEKWKVDRKGMISKLQSLTPAQHFTLVDAAERYWNIIAKHETMEQPDPGEVLKHKS